METKAFYLKFNTILFDFWNLITHSNEWKVIEILQLTVFFCNRFIHNAEWITKDGLQAILNYMDTIELYRNYCRRVPSYNTCWIANNITHQVCLQILLRLLLIWFHYTQIKMEIQIELTLKSMQIKMCSRLGSCIFNRVYKTLFLIFT